MQPEQQLTGAQDLKQNLMGRGDFIAGVLSRLIPNNIAYPMFA